MHRHAAENGLCDLRYPSIEIGHSVSQATGYFGFHSAHEVSRSVSGFLAF